MACEYAKCKKHALVFRLVRSELHNRVLIASTASCSVAAMTEKPNTTPASDLSAAPRKPLSPQAQRALAEAEERRVKAAAQNAKQGPKEIQGPSGPEPTRFGDWERKGIASDF